MAKRTNGEGTIYQRSNGLWCAELTIGYDANGKRIKKSFSSMDLEKLHKKLNDEKYRMHRNIITDKCDYTLAEWVDFWLTNYKAIELKSSTYDRYEYAFNTHVKDRIGHIKLSKLRPDMIQQVYNQMYNAGLSTSSIKQVHIALNQAFNQAIQNNYLFQNPCKATTIPKTEPKKSRALTIAEQNAFVQHCPNTTYGNLFIFALNTGMRCGEITALIWRDINLQEMMITVERTAGRIINRGENAESKTKIVISAPKTSKGIRKIPINKAAKKILLAQKHHNELFVFSSKNGNILMSRNIKRAFDSILDKADLPNDITVHSLRHTFATRLLEKGANIKVVSEILGHASIQVTLDVYSHVMPSLKKDTIALLDV